MRIRVWRSKPLLQGFARSSIFIVCLFLEKPADWDHWNSRRTSSSDRIFFYNSSFTCKFFDCFGVLKLSDKKDGGYGNFCVCEGLQYSLTFRLQNSGPSFLFFLHIVSRKLEFCEVCQKFWSFWRLWRFYRILCFGCKWTPLTQFFAQIGSRRRCAGSQTDQEGVASWQWPAAGISFNDSWGLIIKEMKK